MLQAALILQPVGVAYDPITIRPTRPESGHSTSPIIFCRHYHTLRWVCGTCSDLAGLQGIGFREPARIYFLQRTNFLYDLWDCKWSPLLYPHWLSTFVNTIHSCYLGTYQSSTCGARGEIARISTCNQVLKMILRDPKCEAIASS